MTQYNIWNRQISAMHITSMKYFDFSILYTTILHEKVKSKQTFCSRVAIFHICQLIAFLSHSLYNMPGLFPSMKVLFCGQRNFPLASQTGIRQGTLEIVFEEVPCLIWGSYQTIYEVHLSRMWNFIMKLDHIQWHPPTIKFLKNYHLITERDLFTEYW